MSSFPSLNSNRKFNDTMKDEYFTKTASSKRRECLRFIHASDIHLGSYQFRNQIRSDDFLHAFNQILEFAISRQVDFIIMSGDVFTSLEILPEKMIRIINSLESFKEKTQEKIPIISIEGNHDLRKRARGMKVKSGQSWLKVLSKLGLIVLLDTNIRKDKGELFPLYDFHAKCGGRIQIKNAMIYGSRYLGNELEEMIPHMKMSIKKKKGIFTILIQHFGILGQIQNIPGVPLRKILPLKHQVDYLALGHYHLQFRIGNWIFNPGSSESASSIDSTLDRGIFLVKVYGKENFSKKVQNIKLQNRRFVWKQIVLKKQFPNQENFHRYIYKEIAEFLQKTETVNSLNLKVPILNLALKGIKPMHRGRLKVRALREFLCCRFPIIDVNISKKFNNGLTTIDKFA
ncbi:MAG: hypothetical protein GF353_19300 [Candidatus Lokiarchaeota archaeon]|nr:hypothetical protein [Candidatus Lokiarchaeota archaeon]